MDTTFYPKSGYLDLDETDQKLVLPSKFYPTYRLLITWYGAPRGIF